VVIECWDKVMEEVVKVMEDNFYELNLIFMMVNLGVCGLFK